MSSVLDRVEVEHFNVHEDGLILASLMPNLRSLVTDHGLDTPVLGVVLRLENRTIKPLANAEHEVQEIPVNCRFAASV